MKYLVSLLLASTELQPSTIARPGVCSVFSTKIGLSSRKLFWGTRMSLKKPARGRTTSRPSWMPWRGGRPSWRGGRRPCSPRSARLRRRSSGTSSLHRHRPGSTKNGPASRTQVLFSIVLCCWVTIKSTLLFSFYIVELCRVKCSRTSEPVIEY